MTCMNLQYRDNVLWGTELVNWQRKINLGYFVEEALGLWYQRTTLHEKIPIGTNVRMNV
jgi:hypothetical protein